MADYYPLLAKALAGLPATTTPDARRAIYDRARKALIGQLRSLKPPLSEDVIAREEAALDAAVARLESERGAAPNSAAPPASAPAAGAPAAPAASAPAPAAAPATRPAPPPRPAPAAPTAARPQAPTAGVAGGGAKSPPPPNVRPAASASASPAASPLRPPAGGAAARAAPRPPAQAPGQPPRPSVGFAAPSAAPPSPSGPPPIGSPAAWSPGAPPPVEAPDVGLDDADDYAPPIAAAPGESFAAPPVRAAGDSGRPAAPGLGKPRARRPWPWVALAALVVVVAVAAGFAVLWKEKPQDLAIKDKENAEASAKPAVGQSKIVERVTGGEPAAASPPAAPSSPAANSAPGAASPDNSQAAAAAPPNASAPQAPSATPAPSAETPIPTVTVPTIPVRPNETAQAGAQGSAGQPPAATAPAVSRAALLMETPGDPQKPKVVVGAATWTLIPAAAGQAQAGPTVQADIDIPDAKLRATVTIKKNVDASLPATHTIDLRFAFADGAEIKGFKDMALPQMRRDDTPTGDSFAGVRVKINDVYFLVGLTRSDADTAHNLELLSTRNWLDFPLLFNDDHIAKLTFEKGATGQSVIAQAIEAWK